MMFAFQPRSLSTWVALYLSSPLSLFAQDFHFEQLSTEHGLPNSIGVLQVIFLLIK